MKTIALELFFKVTGLQGISYSVSLTFLPERKKQRNPPGLEQSLGRGFWSRIPAPFPRQFCISRTSVISIPSNFSFPIPQPLPSPASRVAIKSRIPSTNFVFFRIIAALYFGYTAYRRIPRIHPSLPDPPWGQVNLFMQRRNRVTLTSKQLEVT